MLRMHFMLLLANVLLAITTEAKHSEFRFENSHLNNMLVNGYMLQTSSSTLSKCALLCVEIPFCASVGFNTEYSDCYIYDYTIDARFNGTYLPFMVSYGQVSNTASAVTTTSLPTNLLITNQLPFTDRCAAALYTYEPGCNLCFKFYSTKLPWSTAQSSCQADGGRLIHLAPQAKFDYIRDTFLVPWMPSYDIGIYVGVYYDNAVCDWTFSDGTGPVPTNYWVANTPILPSLGECAYFDLTLNPFGIIKQLCTVSYPYICEII